MARRRLRKRVNGEGSIYYRECDGRWAAEITVGYDDRGRQLNIACTARLKPMRARSSTN